MTKTEEKKLIKEMERVLTDIKDAHRFACFDVNRDGVILELSNIIEMLKGCKQN